jgi:hypothetical protein
MTKDRADALHDQFSGLGGITGGSRSSIALLSGRPFDLSDPDPAMIQPGEIAHALSQLCRWTGHCKPFFSVAQHCVVVSRIVPPEFALQGLLHDASEAFVGDVSSPLKSLLNARAPGVFPEIEGRILEAVARRFGAGWPFDESVKRADMVSAATERRDLMTVGGWWGSDLPDPLPDRLQTMSSPEAEEAWLDRFTEVTQGVVVMRGMAEPETVLDEAQRLIYGERQAAYGHPRDNFRTIADLWNDYLLARNLGSAAAARQLVEPVDAAAMLILLKVARMATGEVSRDALVDVAGYAAVAARLEGIDE